MMDSIKNQLSGRPANFVVVLEEKTLVGFLLKDGKRVTKRAEVELQFDIETISANALAQALKELKDFLKIRKSALREAIFVLKANVTSFMTLETPQLQGKTLSDYVTSILRENPTVDVSKNYYPYKVISQTRNNRQNVLVTVTSRHFVEKIIDAANQSRIIPLFLISAPLAAFNYLKRTYGLAVDKKYLFIQLTRDNVFSVLIKNYALSTIIAHKVAIESEDSAEDSLVDEIKKFILFSESTGDKIDHIIVSEEIEGKADQVIHEFPDLDVVNVEDFYKFSSSLLPVFGALEDMKNYPDIENINMLPTSNTRAYSYLKLYYLLRFWGFVQLGIILVSLSLLGGYYFFLKNFSAQLANSGFQSSLTADERKELDGLRASVEKFNSIAKIYEDLSARGDTTTLLALERVVANLPSSMRIKQVNVGGKAFSIVAVTPDKTQISTIQDTLTKAIPNVQVSIPLNKIQDSGKEVQFEIDVTIK